MDIEEGEVVTSKMPNGLRPVPIAYQFSQWLAEDSKIILEMHLLNSHCHNSLKHSRPHNVIKAVPISHLVHNKMKTKMTLTSSGRRKSFELRTKKLSRRKMKRRCPLLQGHRPRALKVSKTHPNSVLLSKHLRKRYQQLQSLKYRRSSMPHPYGRTSNHNRYQEAHLVIVLVEMSQQSQHPRGGLQKQRKQHEQLLRYLLPAKSRKR